MIIYIFNGYFPDNSGFGIRCKREIDAISKDEPVVIVCRGENEKKDIQIYKSPHREITIYRYYSNSQLVERPKKYLTGFYEIKRNLELMMNLCLILYKTLQRYIKEEKKLYVVTSPLTVPFFAWMFSKVNKTKLHVLEFHDLEPELAEHIKGLHQSSIVYKIEIGLEKFLCNRYTKIIVTSRGQADKIVSRTGVKGNKIHVIPNTVEENKNTSKNMAKTRKELGLSREDFVLGCFSSFSYEYTFIGVVELIKNFEKMKERIPNTKLLLVGAGDGLDEIKKSAKGNSAIIITGRVKDIHNVIPVIDVGIVPWKQDSLTESILPTKLFDYMSAKKAIVAPNYGEFKSVLTHKKNALLYDTFDQFIKSISTLEKDSILKVKLSAEAYKLYDKLYRPEKYEKVIRDIVNV